MTYEDRADTCVALRTGIVVQCHGSAGETREISARTTLEDISTWRCRARRVWTPKDEHGDQSWLAVDYWVTGNEPVGNYIGEKTENMTRELGRRKRWKVT